MIYRPFMVFHSISSSFHNNLLGLPSLLVNMQPNENLGDLSAL
jgi:hypothetical protein